MWEIKFNLWLDGCEDATEQEIKDFIYENLDTSSISVTDIEVVKK